MFMLWAYRSDACDEGLLLRSVSLPKWFYAKATSERVGVIVFLMDHTCSMHLFGKPRWIWQRCFTSFPSIEQHHCEISANVFPFFFFLNWQSFSCVTFAYRSAHCFCSTSTKFHNAFCAVLLVTTMLCILI